VRDWVTFAISLHGCMREEVRDDIHLSVEVLRGQTGFGLHNLIGKQAGQEQVSPVARLGLAEFAGVKQPTNRRRVVSECQYAWVRFMAAL
jgi:hypothetical protein